MVTDLQDCLVIDSYAVLPWFPIWFDLWVGQRPWLVYLWWTVALLPVLVAAYLVVRHRWGSPRQIARIER